MVGVVAGLPQARANTIRTSVRSDMGTRWRGFNLFLSISSVTGLVTAYIIMITLHDCTSNYI